MEVNGLKYSDGNNSMVLIRPGDVIKFGDATEEAPVNNKEQKPDPEGWKGVPYRMPEAAKEEYKPYDWDSMPRAQWDIEKGWH